MCGCSCHTPGEGPRRGFLKKAAATIIGAVLGLVPLGAGVAVWLDPLRRRSTDGGAIRVTTLDSVPADGQPRKFPVLATRVDGWNRTPNVPIGAVYLRRTPDGRLDALNVVCPHAGCFIDFLPDRGSYLCPCHNSAFTVDGKLAEPSSPSPRAMDSLDVEIRNEKEIWVTFRNFVAGRAEKIPAS